MHGNYGRRFARIPFAAATLVYSTRSRGYEPLASQEYEKLVILPPSKAATTVSSAGECENCVVSLRSKTVLSSLRPSLAKQEAGRSQYGDGTESTENLPSARMNPASRCPLR